MSNKRTFWAGMILAVAISLGGGVLFVWASTVNWTSQTGTSLMVGGAPVSVSWSHTNGTAEAAYTVGMPSGFIPDYVMAIDDYDATNPVECEWFYGMAAASAIKHTNGTAGLVYTSSNGISVNATTGEITVGTDCTIASGNEIGVAERRTR